MIKSKKKKMAPPISKYFLMFYNFCFVILEVLCTGLFYNKKTGVTTKAAGFLPLLRLNTLQKVKKVLAKVFVL